MKLSLRNLALGLISATAALAGSTLVGWADFPEKPITIMAYMKPGAAADVDSRKFASIAQRLTGKTFVVENKPGAGGIVAMKYVLDQPADGYLVMPITKSQIYKIVTAKSDIKVEDFQWLALTQRDPEALITSTNSGVNGWEQIMADAKAKGAKGEKQVWVGPAAGGLDHVMAMKVWDAAGIDANHVKYVPFKSGKEAISALLGGQGVVYVGNPRDTVGQPTLDVAALSRPDRMTAFPDAPTFKDLGVTGLDNEIMWRGFTAKAGLSKKAHTFWNDLFEKLSTDEEWLAHIEQSNIDPVYVSNDAFLAIVQDDMNKIKEWASKAGILN